MKLNKDNRPKIRMRVVISTVIVAAIVGITVVSFTRGGNIEDIENLGVVGVMDTAGEGINSVVSYVGGFFSDMIHFRSNSKKAADLTVENEKLRQEIIKLKSEKARIGSLDSLQRALNYVSDEDKTSLISASIIGKNDGNWYKSFVIGAGSDNGVRSDSVVINGDGVVGIVYSVSPKYCKAISLIDSKASVSFQVVGKNEAKGIITNSSDVGLGNLKDIKKYLRGYMFDSKSKIKVGDELVTSGLGLYPQNIPIGKVTEVTFDKNKSMKFIKAKPAVDFENLNEVSIIPPRRIE